MTSTSPPPMARHQWTALSKELDSAASLMAHGVQILTLDHYSVLDAPAVFACLATGAEKLLKLTVGMVTIDDTGTWPDKSTMAVRYRHRIVDLDGEARKLTAERVSRSTAPGYIRKLLTAVGQDSILNLILEALDSYARQGRFYNLDMMADAPQPGPSPSELWSNIESEIMQTDPSLLTEISQPDTYSTGRTRLNKMISSSVERWWELYYRAWVTGAIGDWAQIWASQLTPRWRPPTRAGS